MRRLVPVVAAAILGGCRQPSFQSGPGTSSSAGDAGNTVGSGTGVTPADGGSTGSAGTDAGTTSSANGAIPTDRRTPSASCEGVIRPLPAVVTYQTSFDQVRSFSHHCGVTSEGEGNVALAVPRPVPERPYSWALLSREGKLIGSTEPPDHGFLIPNTVGYSLVSYDYNSSHYSASLWTIDEFGHGRGVATVLDGSVGFIPTSRAGFVLALTSNSATAPDTIRVFADGTLLWGPKSLAKSGGVVSANIDDEGRVLVLQFGGDHSLAGQWFDRDGTDLTGSFVIGKDLVFGENASFTGAPLHGSGLAIHKYDFAIGMGSFTVFENKWIAVVPSGSTEARAAPDWLTTRPGASFVRTRGGYALFHWDRGVKVQPCVEHVELLSATGASCGTLDVPVDSESCTPGGLGVGLDGTLLQMLPEELETTPDPSRPYLKTCTLRFWPAALP
ncbi:MAG TPA: hypothetical protein VII08_11035 [Myxococcales bacterium]